MVVCKKWPTQPMGKEQKEKKKEAAEKGRREGCRDGYTRQDMVEKQRLGEPVTCHRESSADDED
jgi:hypothetical protein